MSEGTQDPLSLPLGQQEPEEKFEKGRCFATPKPQRLDVVRLVRILLSLLTQRTINSVLQAICGEQDLL